MSTSKPSAESVEADLPPGAKVEHNVVDSNLAQRKHWLGFLLFSLFLTALFLKALYSLVIHAAGNDLHSHILLIPLVSAYVIWLGRERLPKDYRCSPGWAALLEVAGFAALMVALAPGAFGWTLSYNDYLALMVLSFLCFLAAGGFVFLGRKWMAAAAFPFAFLIFMVPMPDAMAEYLETGSKLASAEAADLFFDMAGTPVLRDGTVFQLPGIVIQVARECSGIRSSWVLLITSLLASELFLRSPWRRMVLVAFVIPLGIVRNGFRIFVVALLCIHFGPRMIHSIIHRQGGPVFFMLSLIPLFFLLWFLRRGETRTLKPDKERVSHQTEERIP